MKGASFDNWAGTVHSQPERWVRPASDAALCEAVGAAHAQGQRVKVVGSVGSSRSSIRATGCVVSR